MLYLRRNKWKRRSDFSLQPVNQWIRYLLVFAFVMMPVLDAGAFVPSGAYILESMIRSMGSCQSLTAVQQTTGLPEHSGPVRETLRFLSPDTIRIDRTAENWNQTILFQAGKKRMMADGVFQEIDSGFSDRYLDMLTVRSADRLQPLLDRYLINGSVSSLGRLEGKPAWVVGAVYPDETSPQIWVDKESYLPIRMLFHEPQKNGTGSRIDIRLMDWKPVQTTWYPSQIVINREKTSVITIEIQHMDVNLVMPADTFEFQTGPIESAPSSETEASIQSRDRETLQKTIENLKQKLRTN